MYTGTGTRRSDGIAAIACCAVITDTSCSTERLPKNTPTRNCSGMRDSLGRAEQDDLALEVDVERVPHGVVCDLDKGEDVRCRGVIHVDDEVRVLRRDLCAADAVSFQPGGLDEPPSLVTRWVLEHTAQAADAVGLRRLAFCLDRIGSLANE